MMRKVFFMLLCAASMVLVGCDRTKDDPTTPQPQDQPLTEADYTIKFYINDSLLQYVNYVVVDSTDLTRDCSSATIAPIDTLNGDKHIWDMMTTTQRAAVPATTIKVITLPVHLNAGTHKFCLVMTRNTTPVHSAKINAFTTTSAYCVTTSKVEVHSIISYAGGMQTDHLDDFITMRNKSFYVKITF